MYTNTSNSPPRIDSIAVREGSFNVAPGGSPEIKIRLAYSNKAKGEGWGFFDSHAQMFSKETMKIFQQFLEAVETDVGKMLFSEGALNLPSSKAESREGLSFKGLGGK